MAAPTPAPPPRGRRRIRPYLPGPRVRAGEDKAFDPLRDLVGDFIRTRFPVGPGDIVFGKPVERRVLHSIRTLSKETGLHPKRLRKLLEAAGALPDGSADLADGNYLFDAQRASTLAAHASAK